MVTPVLPAAGVFLAGILAGGEVVVRCGLQPALCRLDDRAHVAARVALVRTLRVVVPIVLVPAVVVAVAVLIAGRDSGGAGFRWAGGAALAAFVLLSFLGTVPINMTVVEWRPDDPPPDWREVVRRWQRIDDFRSAAAVAAFAFFVAALAVPVS